MIRQCRWIGLWECLFILGCLDHRGVQMLADPLIFNLRSSLSSTAQPSLSFDCLPSPCGLVGWWPGDASADDLFGGNHGVQLHGTNLVSGKVGRAFFFNGSDDGVEISNANRVFDLVNAWTIEAWVMPLTDGFDYRNGPIVWKIARNGLNEDTFFLGWHDQNTFLVGLERASDGEDLLLASLSHETNRFHHVVGSYDGADLKIYVNGALENSRNIGRVRAYTGSAPLRIGNNLDSNHGFAGVFQGAIDEVAIYNRALTPLEVARIFEVGKDGKCKTGFPPNVDIRSPANSATFAAPATVPISAEACGLRGAITNVVFFQGSIKLAEATGSPHTFIWTNVMPGTYALTARATDDQGATGVSSSVLITVTGVEPPPAISINDVSLAEGHAGITNAILNVSLSKASSRVVTIEYSTANGTAIAGADYIATAGRIIFVPGDRNKVIVIPVLGDDFVETNETFFIQLQNPINATMARDTALVTIVNDDAPNLPPTISISAPVNHAAFPPGTNISILATALDPDGTISRVDFYVGSRRLGTVTNSPYSLTWTNVSAGDYALAAVAVDNLNLTNASTPVHIVVTDFSAEVAIVRNFPDLEIAQLQDYLFEIGLSSRVFDRQGLTYEALERFKLLIWDDLGVRSPGLGDNEVGIFHRAFTNGSSLYLIGENLASATTNLSESQRLKWTQLTHLDPTDRKGGGNDLVTLSQEDASNRIVKGRFGVVEDFLYSNRLELATVASGDAQVLGQSRGGDILVASPRLDEADLGGARTFTQNCRVTTGSEASLQQRKELFQNAVCWLIRCPTCNAIDVALDGTASTSAAPVDDQIIYSLVVRHSGECEATGVVVTNRLSPNAHFVSADSAQGLWSQSGDLVVFTLGHIANGSEARMNIVVQTTVTGTITNLARVRVNGPEVTLENNSIELISVVVKTLPPALNILSTSPGRYQLRLTGSPGQRYAIEASSSMDNWTTLTNILNVGETLPIDDSVAGQIRQRFYRARLLLP